MNVLLAPAVEIWSAAQRFYIWCHRHPMVGGSLLVSAFVWALMLIAAAPAYADDAAAAVALTDSQGVPVDAYQLLAIDVSRIPITNSLPPDQWLKIEAWKLSVETAKAFIEMMAFVLAFSWIDWVATPVSAIATMLHQVIGDAGWIPFALSLTAFVAGIAIWSGRTGSGVLEILSAAIAVALIGGALADPTQFLVREGGGFDTMQRWGQQLSEAIVGTSDAQFGDAITQPLVDVLVRMPYQMISFNEMIDGSCGSAFTEAMLSPQATEDNFVWQEVARCDAEAGAYVESGSPRVLWLLLIAGTGRMAVLLLIGAMSVIFFILVLFALWHSIMLVIGLFKALLPGNRRMAWKAGLGMVASLLSMLAVLVLMGSLLRVVVDFISQALEVVSFEIIMLSLTALVIVMLVIVIIAVHRMLSAAKASGGWLGRLGVAMPEVPKSNLGARAASMAHNGMQLANAAANVQQSKKLQDLSSGAKPAVSAEAGRAGAAAGGSASGGAPATPSLEGTFEPIPDPAAGGARAPEPSKPDMPAAADFSDGHPRPSKSSAAKSVLKSGAKVALAAAASGGSAAVVAAAGEIGVGATGAWRDRAAAAGAAAGTVGSSRRIAVDSTGQGMVLTPNRAPISDEGQLPATSPQVLELREQLQSARAGSPE